MIVDENSRDHFGRPRDVTTTSAMAASVNPPITRSLWPSRAGSDHPSLDADRTRAVLTEALPSGQGGVDTVARRLAVSSRTLQRRLRSEGTSFKAVVDDTRESLARHYLRRTQMTATEIAYLLGFDEATSFFRAFQRWTGTTPETLRQQLTAAPMSA